MTIQSKVAELSALHSRYVSAAEAGQIELAREYGVRVARAEESLLSEAPATLGDASTLLHVALARIALAGECEDGERLIPLALAAMQAALARLPRPVAELPAYGLPEYRLTVRRTVI